MARIVLIGEPLVELAQVDAEGGTFRRGLGGDTLNSAIYMARLLGPGQVRYVTRLGTDRLSDWILSEIAAEGIEASIVRETGKAPGLSMIETDPDGERSFVYWRSQSPARNMLSGDENERAILENAPALFVTAVALAVIAPAARATLIEIMSKVKAAGRQVYFDLNFRPALWENTETAQQTIAKGIAASTFCLPSLDDIQALWNRQEPDDAIEQMLAHGATRILLKTGGGPVHHARAGDKRSFPLVRIEQPVDTTGAGDSFNAAFIAKQMQGGSLKDCVAAGHNLASQVVQHRGAIIPDTCSAI